MNVTELAEQIVFGTTIEDKLAVPGRLSFDAFDGPDVSSLGSPCRPVGLQMQHAAGQGNQPPAESRLESESGRGQLLHFLANHELLATELMALVLLKFPNAPRAFRQGVLVTLQEEQEHTRMYLRRMGECGVEFGSFPLSGQFWRVVEPMQSPMDFVSRLSLTFEQANLDYSFHFASVFRKIGDTSTADILQRIYEDEIGHVQHGLHWFRQWKNPDQSDWDAYQETLEFPMSPQRGKGAGCEFNRLGRIEAGLSEHFIDSIEVFRQSRGRAPTLRWFDPAAETELAGILSDKDQLLMKQLGQDLELVMIPMSKQDDVVLVRRLPSRGLLKHLIDAGIDLPEFSLFDDRQKLTVRKLHNFSPWAWTPSNYAVAQPLLESVRHRPRPWCPDSIELYRKSWSVDRLKRWLPDGLSYFAPLSCCGVCLSQIEELEKALKTFADLGYKTAVFKKDLSASGRGQRRLPCGEPLRQEDWDWLHSVFSLEQSTSEQKDSAPVVGVIEPELARLLDLSFLWQFHPNSDELEFLGWTRANVTQGRRYAGTQIGTHFADCDGFLKRFLLEDRCSRLRETEVWLRKRLSEELKDRNFQGYVGVDAFVFTDGAGELKIKPCVELNPRMTMGHVALSLEKRLAQGVMAQFRIFTRAQWLKIDESFDQYVVLKSNDGGWRQGVVRLGEFSQNTKLIPVLLVGRELVERFGGGASCT